MSQAHPMWSRIKQGMLMGGIIGLHIGFLFTLDWLNVASYHQIFDMLVIGASGGFLVGSAGGLIWLKAQAPFKRLEGDLQSAASLRAKELINEQDYHTLKARILGSYDPKSSGWWSVLVAASWMGLIGATISLGAMTAQYGRDLYSNDVISGAILPTVGAGIALGAAIAAVIQSALENGRRGPMSGKSTRTAMLNTANFDPLSQMQNEVDRIPAKR